jgi:hypothetical protein
MVATEADALAKDGVGVVAAQEIGQAAGAMREDEAMDVDVVLHHGLKGVEGVVEPGIGQRGEELFGFFEIGDAAGVANGELAIFDGGFLGGVHFAEGFFRGSAEGLDLGRVAIEYFEGRQGLSLGGKLVGHAEGREHGHRGVEAGVVFAAEGFGVGQRPRGHEVLEVCLTALEHAYELGLEPIEGCALEQIDEGVVAAERKRGLAFAGK